MKSRSTSILITGVSSGIGLGIARQFLQQGYHVIGSVRKQADADRLSATLGSSFTPLIFDVTDEKSVQQAADELARRIPGLCGLINNAGIAIGGPLADMPMEDIRHHFNVNVFGLLTVTRAFLPLLGARSAHSVQPGKIINISSVAGKIGVPFLGAYSASKFAVEGLSESLRRELQLYDIDLVVAGPGNVITPIWDKSENADSYRSSAYYTMYKKFYAFMQQDSRNGFTEEEIGKRVYTVFKKKNPSVRYALVKARIKDWIMPRAMPSRMLDKLFGKATGLLS